MVLRGELSSFLFSNVHWRNDMMDSNSEEQGLGMAPIYPCSRRRSRSREALQFSAEVACLAAETSQLWNRQCEKKIKGMLAKNGKTCRDEHLRGSHLRCSWQVRFNGRGHDTVQPLY